MTRMYVPTSVPRLRDILAGRTVPVGAALAVDDARRRELPDWSEEDLEYLVLQDAALRAVHLLAADTGAGDDSAPGTDAGPVPVRAVIAVDVSDRTADDSVPWSAVAAIHLDAAEAGPAVAAAVQAVRSGRPATDELDALLDIDLAWFTPGEIAFALDDLDAGREPGER
ncbi:DUF6912 family protein [Nakamurella leprariae]|uniref:Uncharacterized protein n=1 Tax=Nakamurella leprariae TaxID=2803911 RepID=A0A938YEN7_9ACTN|nr:hypothetical protein [Nakamurella leprariae]MBM9468208.1 hypothetical protein [Nakamurella leprariae]